jgi:hypothetical protein
MIAGLPNDDVLNEAFGKTAQRLFFMGQYTPHIKKIRNKLPIPLMPFAIRYGY